LNPAIKASLSSSIPSVKRIVFAVLALAVGTLSSQAAEKLAGIFADNLVLQRDRPVPVWGWAENGHAIKVTFGNQVKTTTADERGHWMVKLDPMPANKTPQVLEVIGATTQTAQNVLVGDVWICSGRSNMSWLLQDSLNGKEEMAAANFPRLRFLRVSQTISPFPLQDASFRIECGVCSPVTERMFLTAVGFFLAREILKEVDVPIGLIGANLGGTCIETWIPLSGFHNAPELSEVAAPEYRKFLEQLRGWLPSAEAALTAGEEPSGLPFNAIGTEDYQQPSKCFNGMINLIIPFALGGVIWYQGEGNGSEGESYFHKMKALITGWRELWSKRGSSPDDKYDFPFYFVQLANFQRSDLEKPEGGDTWTRLREAQLKSLSIPNIGMAVAIDIGEADSIHPGKKQDAGRRPALWALAKDYGKDMTYIGPLSKSHEVEGETIRIQFEHAGDGLLVGEKHGLDPASVLPEGKLQWFSNAGEDRKWHWADAVIVGDSVVVSHPEVKKPIAVRYAFALNSEGANLYNKNGLPASPFRTDDWP